MIYKVLSKEMSNYQFNVADALIFMTYAAYFKKLEKL